MTNNIQVSAVYPTLLPVGNDIGSKVTCVRLFGNNFKDKNDLYKFASDKTHNKLELVKKSVTPEELVKMVSSVKGGGAANHVLLTGGEVLCQMDSVAEFMENYSVPDTKFDIETNELLKPSAPFDKNVSTYFVQLKLSNSLGGPPSNTFSSRINKESIDFFIGSEKSVFVAKVATPSDIGELRELMQLLKISEDRVWLMPIATENRNYINQAAYIWRLCLNSAFRFAHNGCVSIFGAPRLDNLY